MTKLHWLTVKQSCTAPDLAVPDKAIGLHKVGACSKGGKTNKTRGRTPFKSSMVPNASLAKFFVKCA